MASKAVSDAVFARLASGFVHPEIAVVKPNTTRQTPADGSRFLVVQFPLSIEDHASLGDTANRLFREEGAFRFVLHGKAGEGANDLLTVVEELRTLFRGVEFSGVITYAPSPAVEHDDNDDGNYYALSTSVPYDYDLIA